MREISSERYKNRNCLLKLCLEHGISNSIISKLVEPMRGKSDKEKEIIAAQIIKEIFHPDREQIL